MQSEDNTMLIKSINAKLLLMGTTPYEIQKKSSQKRLLEIEKLITQKDQNRDEAIAKLKKSAYTIKSISDDLGCSRTTLYNDALLKSYIEFSSIQSDAGNPVKQVDAIKDDMSELRSQVSLMQTRDVNELRLKLQIKDLENKLAESQKMCERLRKKMK